MSSPTKTFLQAVQTAVAAILNGSDKAFNSVVICADTAQLVERLQGLATRFPACVIVDEGGYPHPHNLKLEFRRFSATVAARNYRGLTGEQVVEQVLDLAELLQAGDGTNPGQRQQFGTGSPIRSLAAPNTQAVGNLGNGDVHYLTLYFEYVLQR